MKKRHKPKKVRILCDFNAGAERMMAKLLEIESVIKAAKRDMRKEKAAGRSGWRYLSAAIAKIRLVVRPKPGTFVWDCAVSYFLDHEPHLRWVADIPPIVPGAGKGLSAVEFINGKYYTPKAALDVVAGESPMEVIPGERPLDAILANPPFHTHSAGAVGNTSSAQAKEPTSTGKLGRRA